MSWKFVFNTNLKNFVCGTDIDTVIKFVKTTGYSFFIFNGQVYDLHGVRIGISTKELS